MHKTDPSQRLVIAAHPDDEVLGCGGTIARLAKEGSEVSVAILGEGITSRYRDPESADRSAVTKLKARCEQVAGLLGVKQLETCSLPDNRFDTIPLLDIVKIVEALVDRFRPRVIYTHHGSDLNIDHAIVHRAVLTALRPMSGYPVSEIYAFEVPSSTEWAFQQFQPAFSPNVFIDISKTLDTKIKALEAYESEIRCFPHPRSAEALCAIARRWGSVAGLQAAEALQLIRLIIQ